MIKMPASYPRKYAGFKNKDAAAIILLLFITAYFYLPLFHNITRAFSCVDWYEKYCLTASSRKAILEYHQFPLRSPFIYGGYPTVGHPYDDSLNPLFLSVLVFGDVIGLKVMIFSIFMLSTLGMFYLTRYVLRYNLLGSFFSAATFILASYGGCQLAEGNLEKLYLYFLPWLLAFFIRAKKEPRFIIAACLALSIFLMKGIIAVSALLFLFIFACLHILERKGPRIRLNFHYILIFLAVVCLALAFCAPKILSGLQLFSQKTNFIHFPFENSYQEISRHTVASGRALSLHRLFDSLLVKDAYIVEGDDFSQMYLGYIPVVLFFASLLVYGKKAWRFVIMLAFFMILSAGPNSPVDLFRFIWRLHPFVRSIWKLDDAFYIYIFFLISMVSGSIFLWLERVKKHRRIYISLAVALIFISIANMFWKNQRFLLHPDINLSEPQFDQAVPDLAPQKSFFQVKLNYPEKTKDDYFYILQNVGVVNYHQNILIQIGSHAIPKYIVNKGDYMHIAVPQGRLKLNPGYRGEAFFLDEENLAQVRYFSPNKMLIRVTMKNPGQLVINQNYHKSWRANIGRPKPYRGLLSLDLRDAGAYEVTLSYVPLDFYSGLVISLAAIACFFIIFRLSGKKAFKAGQR